MKLKAFAFILLGGLIFLVACGAQATPSGTNSTESPVSAVHSQTSMTSSDRETQLESKISELEKRVSQLEQQITKLLEESHLHQKRAITLDKMSQLEQQLTELSKEIRLEQEKAIAFTKAALEIEAQRNDIVANLAKGWNHSSFKAGLAISFRTRVEGKLNLSNGVASLRNKLALLDCPNFLLNVKIMLLQVYELELESAETITKQGSLLGQIEVKTVKAKGFNPTVNKDNVVDYQEMVLRGIHSTNAMPGSPIGEILYNQLHGPWVEAQLIRREAYKRWAKILREHGVDPAKQGFTELAKY